MSHIRWVWLIYWLPYIAYTTYSCVTPTLISCASPKPRLMMWSPEVQNFAQKIDYQLCRTTIRPTMWVEKLWIVNSAFKLHIYCDKSWGRCSNFYCWFGHKLKPYQFWVPCNMMATVHTAILLFLSTIQWLLGCAHAYVLFSFKAISSDKPE